MNRTEATARIADALGRSKGYGIDHVAILTPIDGRPDVSVILVRTVDAHLSVTVEMLAP